MEEQSSFLKTNFAVYRIRSGDCQGRQELLGFNYSNSNTLEVSENKGILV